MFIYVIDSKISINGSTIRNNHFSNNLVSYYKLISTNERYLKVIIYMNIAISFYEHTY